MNRFFEEIFEKYKENKNKIQTDYASFFEKKANNIFWDRWTRAHYEMFGQLSLESSPEIASENFDDIQNNFMKKRARLASSFFQGLKLEKELNCKNSHIVFKKLLQEHDVFLSKILTEILEYFSQELIKIQRFRKVTAAYSHLHLSQGG